MGVYEEGIAPVKISRLAEYIHILSYSTSNLLSPLY